MKVSIITVSFNSELFIRDAIESVVHQKYKDIEYIIIDGGSTDKTISIISDYVKQGKIAKFISEPDNGIYDAMNKGIKMATGDIVSFLNSDDLYYDDEVISDVVRVFSNSKDTKICYGDAVYVDRHDNKKIIRYWKPGIFSEKKLKKGWQPCHLAFFAKRELFEVLGGFKTKYTIAADYELIVRFIINNKDKAFYLPRIIGKMRVGGVSSSSFTNILKANIECYQSLNENNVKVNLSFVVRKPMSKIRQFFTKRKSETTSE